MGNIYTLKQKLSPRESDIMSGLLEGTIDAESLGKKFGISRNTVRIHLRNINIKMGTTSKSGLLVKYIKEIEAELEQRDLTIKILENALHNESKIESDFSPEIVHNQ